MQKQPLEYAHLQSSPEPSRVWDTLAGLSLLMPFLSVPIFFVGTALLQDMLVSGGGSWHRAALIAGVLTASATVATVAGAIRKLASLKDGRGLAIFAVVANAVALVLILAGMITA